MTINSEYINAQTGAFNHQPTQSWHRHIMPPSYLEWLIESQQKLEEENKELLQKLEDSEKAKNIYRSIIQFLMNGSVIGDKR